MVLSVRLHQLAVVAGVFILFDHDIRSVIQAFNFPFWTLRLFLFLNIVRNDEAAVLVDLAWSLAKALRCVDGPNIGLRYHIHVLLRPEIILQVAQFPYQFGIVQEGGAILLILFQARGGQL